MNKCSRYSLADLFETSGSIVCAAHEDLRGFAATRLHFLHTRCRNTDVVL